MCGLAGFVTTALSNDSIRTLRGMSGALVHRGPDDAGEWIDAACGVALGFRRLAILDLSSAGHQPMTSASGRFVAILNGEIYNFEELRRALRESGAAPAFRGHSDTEVMLAAFDTWGIEAAVKRFNGMFAIVVWDRERRRLQLIRDRMGVKPLYYGMTATTFLFASELKALRQHPDFEGRIDKDALHLYFRVLYVPAPYSIYEGIRKVMPGTILTFEPSTRQIETTVYWSLREVVLQSTSHRFDGSEDEASRELERLLRDSIRLRMVADVPTGVLLSSGIDSALVAALMQSESRSPIKSFTIGFDDPSYDEAPLAGAVARHLGTDHAELYVSEGDVADVVPDLPSIYDEPFAGSSQIARVLVSRFARNHIAVSLTGEGGDELFGGYDRYSLFERIPSLLRPLVGRILVSIPQHVWDRVLAIGRPMLPEVLRQLLSGARIHKIARVLSADDLETLSFALASQLSDLALGRAHEPGAREEMPELVGLIERMMFVDQTSSLHDVVLMMLDRATMAVSLEAREPLLDYRLVEYSWTLPLSMKVRGGSGKRVLRRVLERYLTQSLIDRPKKGFQAPIGRLLRGRLRDWAESLLDPATLRAQGFLEADTIREKWNDHLRGNGNWKYRLWGVLMLQAWLQHNSH